MNSQELCIFLRERVTHLNDPRIDLQTLEAIIESMISNGISGINLPLSSYWLDRVFTLGQQMFLERVFQELIDKILQSQLSSNTVSYERLSLLTSTLIITTRLKDIKSTDSSNGSSEPESK